MKRTRLFNYSVILLMSPLFVMCPSECENDESDCYSDEGRVPCDTAAKKTTTKDQKTLAINRVENDYKNNEIIK